MRGFIDYILGNKFVEFILQFRLKFCENCCVIYCSKLTLFVGYYTTERILNMIYFVNSLYCTWIYNAILCLFLLICGIITICESKIGLDFAAFYATHIHAKMSVL